MCLQSTERPWVLASVDGISTDGRSVVEIKCWEAVYRHASSTNQVPGYYRGQLQHILLVTRLPTLDFWGYLPERPEVHI